MIFSAENKGGDAVKNEDDFDSGFGDDGDDGDDPILDLLATCAQWLVSNPDPQAFIVRMAQEGPSRFAALLEQEMPEDFAGTVRPAAGQTSAAGQFFRAFAWSIASAMPLPGNDFRPRKLPAPGRNDPCVCGSGAKFKNCCSGFFAHLPPLDPELLGALVVRALPAGSWAGLPHQHVTPAMVATAGQMLCDEGRDEDALLLMEPWAKLPPPWPDSRADLLDLLGDLYLDMGLQAEREQLAHNMVKHGGEAMQSMGWQRLCLMATDAGDEAGARQAFEAAQRLTPNEPRVALLEVTSLLGQGHAQRARERAAFHVKRLSRLPDAFAIAGQIEALQELAESDSELSQRASSLLSVDGAPHFVAALERWLEALPPPKLRLTLPAAPCADLGQLQPTAAAREALRLWHTAFEFTSPRMAWEAVDDDALDALAGDDWLPVLRQHPLLADCFDVLDGLLLALGVLPTPQVAHLQTLLLERALQLWLLLRERHPRARCEWGHLGNRPALRLLALRIDLDRSLRADEAYPWLSHLVAVLNPNDNHGLRERLAAVYLRRAETQMALELCERYPEDALGMTLLHARALLALGRLDEAAVRLDEALACNEHARKLLQASRAPRVPDMPTYRVGSLEEARLALQPQFDLWRSNPAVWKWLQQRLAGPQAAGGDTGRLFD